MYSPLIIKSKLDTAQSIIDKSSDPFSLRYFSLHESQYLTNQIESKWTWEDKDKNLGRYSNLSHAEKLFIKNEKIISANNFLYWARRYAKVKHWSGHKLVSFIPYFAQKVMVNTWGDLEEKGWAIVIQILKARQLGLSTIVELAIAHRVQFLSNRNALVASSDPQKTRKMAEMMARAWDNQPRFLQQANQPYESGELFRYFPEMESSVSCQHGNKLSGIARGDTPSDAHISEIPDFNNPEEHIEASLFNAMHENPEMFIALESTAKGKQGDGKWWYDTWVAAKEGWPKGESDIRPVFLPYFMGTEIYPTKTWLKKTLFKKGIKSLDEWKPSKRTIAHSLACQRYVRDTDYLYKVLGKNWKLPKEQQFWWEFKYEQAKKRDTLHKFLEEAPANDLEAFQASGRPIFSAEFISQLNDYKHDLASYHGKPAVFKIIGHDIPEEFEPERFEVDDSRPPIKIVSDWAYGKYRHEYLLLPVHHDQSKWQNRLFVWEFPFKDGDFNQKYCNGVDCGDGIELDNTVMNVVKKGTYSKPAHQVAEFASPNLIATALYPWAEAVGTWYSHVNDDFFNQCRQAIEVQRGGNDLQYTFIKTGWSNFHEWEGSYDNAKRRTIHKLGWETNYWARGMLLAKNIKAIKDWYFRIHSPRFIAELAELQKGDGTDRIEGEEHDDFIFSGFISYFSLHVKELYQADLGEYARQHLMKPSKQENEESSSTILDPRQRALDELNNRGLIMDTSLPTPDYNFGVEVNEIKNLVQALNEEIILYRERS